MAEEARDKAEAEAKQKAQVCVRRCMDTIHLYVRGGKGIRGRRRRIDMTCGIMEITGDPAAAGRGGRALAAAQGEGMYVVQSLAACLWGLVG